MILNVIYLLRKRLTMKKTLILFALLLLNFNLFAQSKKEIIQTLNIRIDSLKLEITNRDIKFEKEKATSNSNRELMLLNISKLENTLVDLNAQIDSAKKNNEKLQEINEQLQESLNQLNNKLLVLNDSIVVLKKENLSLRNSLERQNPTDKVSSKVKSFDIKKSDLPSWFDKVERTYMLNDDRILGPEDFPEIIGGFLSNKGEIFFINGEEIIFQANQIQSNIKGSIFYKVLKSGQYTIKITIDEKLTTGAYSEGKISLLINDEPVFISRLIVSGF